MLKDKTGSENYFLDSKVNHRITVLLILSDGCKELSLDKIEAMDLLL